jgi:acyl-CoA synthetase (AMP-forming)/AMP-acid ligase II
MPRLIDRLYANAHTQPDRPAVLSHGTRLSHAALFAQAEQLAAQMCRHGLAAGDRVLVHARSSAASLVVVVACLSAGFVLATLHHSFDDRKLALQLRDCGARALFIDRDVPASLWADVPGLTGILRGDLPRLAWEARPAHAGSARPAPSAPEDAAAIFYTSGSSSQPKGVLVNHANMLAAVDAVSRLFGNTAQDRILSYSSLTSDYGFYNALVPLSVGASVVLEAQPPAEASAVATLMDDEGVTGLQAFPPLLVRLAAELPLTAPRHLRYVSSSGQAWPAWCMQALQATWPHVSLFANYGLTECKRVACMPPGEWAERPGSVGRPLPSVRAYLVDGEGRLLEEMAAEGELVVASDMVMQGYWQRPQDNARALRDHWFGEPRALMTGDRFRRDMHGYLYPLGRMDDAFARHMLKVDPREVERVLLSRPGVLEAAVVPAADPVAGQVPVAYVVPRAGFALTEGDILAHCSSQLDWHMVPTAIHFLTELPTTASGKWAPGQLAPSTEVS